MSFYDSMKEADKRLWDRAEWILTSWDKGEIALDGPRAHQIVIQHQTRKVDMKGKERTEEVSVSVANLMTNGLGQYRRFRGSPRWEDGTNDLTFAWDTAKAHGVDKVGYPVERQIADLNKTIEDLRNKMKNMFEECPRCSYKNVEVFEGKVEDGSGA